MLVTRRCTSVRMHVHVHGCVVYAVMVAGCMIPRGACDVAECVEVVHGPSATCCAWVSRGHVDCMCARGNVSLGRFVNV